jgi:hypothetical protein
MIFEITNIVERGILAKERVIIKATREGDIGRFAVFRAHTDSEGSPLSGNVANCFWFSDKTVKAGDLVVLYTKEGIESEKLNDSGSTSHFFYWDLSEPLWDAADHVAILVNTSDWGIFRKKTVKKSQT